MAQMTADNNLEAYLHAFERVVVLAGWPCYQWATILMMNLVGAGQATMDTLPVSVVQDYNWVKEVILGVLNVSKKMRMQAAEYDPAKGPRCLPNIIRVNGMRWLKQVERSTEEMVELPWLEQFVGVLLSAAQSWVLS